MREILKNLHPIELYLLQSNCKINLQVLYTQILIHLISIKVFVVNSHRGNRSSLSTVKLTIKLGSNAINYQALPIENNFITIFNNNFYERYSLDDFVDSVLKSRTEINDLFKELNKFNNLEYILNKDLSFTEKGRQPQNFLNNSVEYSKLFKIQHSKYFEILFINQYLTSESTINNTPKVGKVFVKENIDREVIDLIFETFCAKTAPFRKIRGKWNWKDYNSGGAM